MSARQSLYGFAMKGKAHSPDNSERMSWEIDAFKAEVLREAAEKIRRHWYPRVPGNPLFTQGMDAGMDIAADLIDPDKEN